MQRSATTYLTMTCATSITDNSLIFGQFDSILTFTDPPTDKPAKVNVPDILAWVITERVPVIFGDPGGQKKKLELMDKIKKSRLGNHSFRFRTNFTLMQAMRLPIVERAGKNGSKVRKEIEVPFSVRDCALMLRGLFVRFWTFADPLI